MMQTALFCPYQYCYLLQPVVFVPTLVQDFSCLSLGDQAPPPPTLVRKTSLKAEGIINSLPQSCGLIASPFYPTFEKTFLSFPQPITPKCKILEQIRKSDATWMKNGKLTEISLFPEDTLLEVTDGFMNSALGKKIV